MSELMEIKRIDIEKIKPNEWNPNAMDDITFNRLTEEIETVGMIDPIQVVPLDDGTFRILGGEHRYQACKILGYDELPCVILGDEKFKDEDLQKFLTMRLNIIKGDLNPERFVDLYNEMADKYNEDSLQHLMGYTNDQAWDKLTTGIREALKDSGMSDDELDKFDAASEEIKTVDDLSVILNEMFTKHGDTLKHSFMVFTFGKKDHIYVTMDKVMKTQMDKVLDFCVKNDVNINSVMADIVKSTVNDLDNIEIEDVMEEENIGWADEDNE